MGVEVTPEEVAAAVAACVKQNEAKLREERCGPRRFYVGPACSGPGCAAAEVTLLPPLQAPPLRCRLAAAAAEAA